MAEKNNPQRFPIRAFCSTAELDHLDGIIIPRLSADYRHDGHDKTACKVQKLVAQIPTFGTLSRAEQNTLASQYIWQGIAYSVKGRWNAIEQAQNYAEMWAVRFDRSTGREGRLFELDMARVTHRYRACWGDTGSRDSARVKLLNPATGKAFATISVEVKTNAGNALNIRTDVPDVVIYRLQGASKQWGEDLPIKIVTGERFVRELEGVNGFNNSKPRTPIQANMKKVWQVVASWPDWVGVEHAYTMEELNGGQE